MIAAFENSASSERGRRQLAPRKGGDGHHLAGNAHGHRRGRADQRSQGRGGADGSCRAAGPDRSGGGAEDVIFRTSSSGTQRESRRGYAFAAARVSRFAKIANPLLGESPFPFPGRTGISTARLWNERSRSRLRLEGQLSSVQGMRLRGRGTGVARSCKRQAVECFPCDRRTDQVRVAPGSPFAPSRRTPCSTSQAPSAVAPGDGRLLFHWPAMLQGRARRVGCHGTDHGSGGGSGARRLDRHQHRQHRGERRYSGRRSGERGPRISSGMVNGGTIHAADAVALQAQSDEHRRVQHARRAEVQEFDLTGKDLVGLTLVAGVCCFSSSAQLSGGAAQRRVQARLRSSKSAARSPPRGRRCTSSTAAKTAMCSGRWAAPPPWDRHELRRQHLRASARSRPARASAVERWRRPARSPWTPTTCRSPAARRRLRPTAAWRVRPTPAPRPRPAAEARRAAPRAST